MAAPMPHGYDAPLKGLQPLIAQILYNRGLAHDDIPDFLAPTAQSSHSPLLMTGMSEAIHVIRTAINAGDPIAVYGDFDVDGVTSAVLLHEVITALGGNSIIYIPHRNTEGYGLNVGALDQLHARGIRLVVTVDCGISSADEVAHALAIGLRVVITDHHTPPPVLPNATAIVNPRQPGDQYPFKDLAGVGVAFKVASALSDGTPGGQRLRRAALDLVAIGTIADMVPLRSENRVLVRHGLPAVTHTRRVGLRALLQRANLDHANLTAYDLGFRIAPRLNAAGRIDHAAVGCRLLMTTSTTEAEELTAALEEKNLERQRVTASIIEEARRRVGNEPDSHALVLDDPEWPVGVVGLVAGRLAEEYSRPVLVIERGPHESRGSARSVAGFNIIEALSQCADVLVKFGGHAGAAGFTLRTADIPVLRERLGTLAANDLRGTELIPKIYLDGELDGRALDSHALQMLFEQFQQLEPFGMGNDVPLLLWRGLRVADCRQVGRDHLRFTFDTGHGTIGAIAFGLARDVGTLPRGTVLDAAVSLQYNDWNGYPVVELRIKDIAVKGALAVDTTSKASLA